MRPRLVSLQRVDLAKAALRRSYAGVALAAASWGTWTVFLRLARGSGPLAPELSSFVVFATMGVVLLPLALRATRRAPPVRSKRDWSLVAAFGVTDALNCALYFAALETTSVAVAVLTHYVAPLLVAVAAPLVLGEPRRPSTLVAVAVGLFGLTLLLSPWNVGVEAGSQLLGGALLGLGSAVFYATNVLLTKRLSRRFEAPELLVYHMPSALLLLALAVPEGGWAISAPALAWLVVGALGPGALAGVVFMRSLAVVPAAHASVLTLVEPFTALAIATFAWGESLAITAVVGGAAILTAAYLVVREARAGGS
jgi:drug/metabolite transporter (DMT)-like permease